TERTPRSCILGQDSPSVARPIPWPKAEFLQASNQPRYSGNTSAKSCSTSPRGRVFHQPSAVTEPTSWAFRPGYAECRQWVGATTERLKVRSALRLQQRSSTLSWKPPEEDGRMFAQ